MTSNGSKRPQVSSAPPRKINVQKFAESRGTELEALHAIVANRLGNDFRSWRNKRRRTTAYDNQASKKRYRKRRKLGVAVDKSNAGLALEKEEQKKVPRRVRRRLELKKNPEIGFTISGDGTKRLRTHVWHAKRFTMTKLWGFHLPLGLQGRGRGSRALLKWFKQGALVHDASYHVAVQLEGPEDPLMSILRNVLVPSPSVQPDDISNSILSGAIYGTAMLHHVGAPVSQPIAPVTYMWGPAHLQNRENGCSDHNSDGCSGLQSSDSCSPHRLLWVWIHASAFSEGYDALKFACQKQMTESSILINCFSLEGQVAKLEIMGSKAFQVLQKTLHPLSCNPENSLQLKKCVAIEADHDPQFKKAFALENEESIPSCSVLSLTVKDPRALPDKKNADIPVSVPTSVLNDVPKDEADKHVALPGISEKNKELPLSSWSKHNGNGNFSDSKTLWDASSGISHPVEESVLCLEKHHSRLDFVCLDDPKLSMLKTSKELQGSRSCPILLLKNNNRVAGLMGWSVVLPLSWVRVFWIPFVSKGAHAIGLREKRWIACEVGLPYFPSDFPDCKVYSSFMETEATALDQKAEQLPPAVRPLKVPIPPPWNSVRVSLDKGSTAVQDGHISSKNDVVNGNSLLNSKVRDCGIALLGSKGNSFDGMLARTASVLTDFLNEIHGDHLLLFPQLPNRETRLLKFMKDESKRGQGQNVFNQVTSNRKLCFIRILLHAYKEGVFEEGAVVCAPGPRDISLWTSRLEDNEGGIQIPQSSVRAYFKEQFSGKWELQIPEEPVDRESHRWPIGFVTTGFVRGSKKPMAEAVCEAVLLACLREEQWNEMPVKHRRKQIYVLVRNLRSSAYRLALATVVLEQQHEDVEFL